MNAVPLKRRWRIISLRYLSFHVMEKAPRIPYPAQKAQCSQPLPDEGHQTQYESLLRLLKKNLSRTCKHTYLWFTHYAHFNSELYLFFQNFTFSDDFSPSSTSSADLSGLGAEPKTPGLSQSLVLSSDEVRAWHWRQSCFLRSYILPMNYHWGKCF